MNSDELQIGGEIWKKCKKCGVKKPLTVEYWYPIRPRKGHKKAGWQSHCKMCWIDINKANKERRKLAHY
jgi:hypothetical protein